MQQSRLFPTCSGWSMIAKKRHCAHFKRTKLQLKNICTKTAASPLPSGCSVGRCCRNSKFSGRNYTTRWRTLWFYYTNKERQAKRQSTKVVNRAHSARSKLCRVFFHIHQLSFCRTVLLDRTISCSHKPAHFAKSSSDTASPCLYLNITDLTHAQVTHFLLLTPINREHFPLGKSLPITALW